MYRRLPFAIGLTAAIVSTSHVAAFADATAATVATVKKTGAVTVKKTSTAKTLPSGALKFTGPVVDTRWGPVQVAITVRAKKIVDVSVPVYPHTKRRSALINDQALPMYHHEAIAAQSAMINNVSGATYTWDGYTTSLQGAIDTAVAKSAI